MNRQLRLSKQLDRHDCKFVDDSPEGFQTKQNLSMSPSQIASMTARGLAVSSSVDESLFFDGTEETFAKVPIERIRGIDAAQVWEAQQTARKKMMTAHRRDVAEYGTD